MTTGRMPEIYKRDQRSYRALCGVTLDERAPNELAAAADVIKKNTLYGIVEYNAAHDAHHEPESEPANGLMLNRS